MQRRAFLKLLGLGAVLAHTGIVGAGARGKAGDTLRLFLCGDVMTGRGIDQAFARSVDPELHERFMKDARGYLQLAEGVNGRIPQPVDPAYPWGDALAVLENQRPAARIINLETAVTARGTPWPGKEIHYRMHPENIACPVAAGVDVAVLANNHVLDWSQEGFTDTLRTLRDAGILVAGAGENSLKAAQPAVLSCADGSRLLVFAAGSGSGGVPATWKAGTRAAGVNHLDETDAGAADKIAEHIETYRRPGDRVIFSLHWGPNWGYGVTDAQRRLARGLIDSGLVDLVHGHSSHHPKDLEIYRGKLILYGCGDFLNDYEGIGGYEAYRPDLTLMYFPVLDGNGELMELHMAPLQIKRFRLHRAPPTDVRWLVKTLQARTRGGELRVENDSMLVLTTSASR